MTQHNPSWSSTPTTVIPILCFWLYHSGILKCMNRKEKSDEKITTDKICYLSFSLKWFICFHLAWPELIWMFFFLNKKQKLPLNTTSNSNVMPNKVLKVVYCELLVCKVEETNLPTADNWCRVEKAVREPGCPFSSCYKCMLTFADNGRIWVSNVDLMSRLGGKKLQKKNTWTSEQSANSIHWCKLRLFIIPGNQDFLHLYSSSPPGLN